ncbi:Alkaline ceramidase 3 [Monascus purpureus]|uniref:Alkaline ceramidase 3 n=1 Tax=Monascus purpureus TaxID=5098 RepID=A0A507QQ01_MONPU|nr:Alkaline ceramidase 3 [Monascus purpureus]
MSHWAFLPHIPYPAAKTGYWSPVTSTLNWCEEDYYATIYSAEIVNALTNLMFVWLGVKGLISYPMQLVDELSMIYTTCLMCYASFSYARPTGVRVFLGIFLTGLAVFITLYYHYLQDPVFHQNAYAILTTIVILRSMYTMEKTLRPKWRYTREEDRLEREKKGLPIPTKERQHYENERDLKILNTMWFMVIYGISVFLGGFFIWTLDNVFCTRLRGWRRAVGLPWGILLEGHGWWHLMTGLGAYMYIIWGIWLRHCLNNRQEEYYLSWSRFWNFPEILRTPPATNGNGWTKKLT